MHESLGITGENGKSIVRLDVVSRGIETSMTISENTLRVQNEQGDVGFILAPAEALFVRCLTNNPNKALLSSEVNRKTPSLYGNKIAALYTGISKKFGPSQSRDNFISFGHGSTKRYGFLSDSDDPSELIDYGRWSIKNSEYSDRRKKKQLSSFDELEAFYNRSEERRYSKKRILGATALTTTISVGGTMIWIYKKTHTK